MNTYTAPDSFVEGPLLSLFPNPTAAQFLDGVMVRFSHHATQPGLIEGALDHGRGMELDEF